MAILINVTFDKPISFLRVLSGLVRPAALDTVPRDEGPNKFWISRSSEAARFYAVTFLC